MILAALRTWSSYYLTSLASLQALSTGMISETTTGIGLRLVEKRKEECALVFTPRITRRGQQPE